MKIKIDKFSWIIIIFALILVAAYFWVRISQIGIDYSQCEGKSCITTAELFGGMFIELTFPIFVILAIIKLIILIIQKIQHKI